MIHYTKSTLLWLHIKANPILH